MTKKIGMIGLGNMGHGMCANFIKHGNEVVCFDALDAAKQRFAGQALLAGSVGEVAEKSDYIFLSLPNSDIVSAVIGEMLQGDVTGKIIVDTSTSYPPTTIALSKQVAEAGGTMIDCGVLAGPPEAETGDLLAVIGGEEAVVKEIEPLVYQIAKSYKHCGPTGSGHLLKIAVNYCSLTQAAMFAQVYPIMKKYGMNEKDVYDGLNNEIFDNWVFQYYSKRYVSHDYWTGFSLENGIKDLSYMKRLYEEQNIPGFVLDGALDLARVTKLQQDGDEKLEMAHMARTMYRLLGFEN